MGFYTLDKETKQIQIKTTQFKRATRHPRLAPRRVTVANTPYTGDLNAVSGRDHGSYTKHWNI